jgi:hypothetical protein
MTCRDCQKFNIGIHWRFMCFTVYKVLCTEMFGYLRTNWNFIAVFKWLQNCCRMWVIFWASLCVVKLVKKTTSPKILPSFQRPISAECPVSYTYNRNTSFVARFQQAGPLSHTFGKRRSFVAEFQQTIPVSPSSWMKKKRNLSHKILTSKYFAFDLYRQVLGHRILTKMGLC